MKVKNLPLVSIETCYCYQDVIILLKLSINGRNLKLVKEYILLHNLDISHFDRNKKNRKYKVINVICPICLKEFLTKEHCTQQQKTCSYSCANTYFRSGINSPSYKEDTAVNYRTLCFRYHKKECIICKEDKIVSVHHYDENHDNNEISNLVPLCPTHHQYVHSRYKHLVQDQIDSYILKFKKNESK